MFCVGSKQCPGHILWGIENLAWCHCINLVMGPWGMGQYKAHPKEHYQCEGHELTPQQMQQYCQDGVRC